MIAAVPLEVRADIGKVSPTDFKSLDSKRYGCEHRYRKGGRYPCGNSIRNGLVDTHRFDIEFPIRLKNR